MSDEVIKVWLEGLEWELPRAQCWMVDRSRILRGESCPQKRHLEYEAGPGGRGMVSARKSEDLALGSAVHAGLEAMLLDETLSRDGFMEIGKAATFAHDSMMQAFEQGIAMQDDENFGTVMPEVAHLLAEEQAALAYGLVWTFGRRRLAGLLARYEVVEVEPEINWLVGDVNVAHDWPYEWHNDPSRTHIVMMSRPDAVLRQRDDGSLWTVSWKTTKRFDASSVEKLECDIQTLTEGLAVRHKYGQMPGGAYYSYFIKGDKWKDSELGVKRYTSELVRPWHNDGAVGGGADGFKARYETYDQVSGKIGRLGKQWRRTDIWKHMPMAEWLGLLDSGEVQPEAGRDWLEEAVAEPIPQRFDEGLAAEWCRTRVQEEARWIEGMTQYPKHSGSCFNFFKKCWAFDQCWHGSTIEEGLVSGRLKVRESNHESEFKEEGSD